MAWSDITPPTATWSAITGPNSSYSAIAAPSDTYGNMEYNFLVTAALAFLTTAAGLFLVTGYPIMDWSSISATSASWSNI